MAQSLPLQILGTKVSGDVAGITIYTAMSGRKVCYPIDHPKKPPSQQQLEARSRFGWFQRAWSALSPGEKATLEDACRRLSLSLTGQNLYISAGMTRCEDSYHAVAREAGVTFPPLPGEPDE